MRSNYQRRCRASVSFTRFVGNSMDSRHGRTIFGSIEICTCWIWIAITRFHCCERCVYIYVFSRILKLDRWVTIRFAGERDGHVLRADEMAAASRSTVGRWRFDGREGNVEKHGRVSGQRSDRNEKESERCRGDKLRVQAESFPRGDRGGSRKLDDRTWCENAKSISLVATKKRPSTHAFEILSRGISSDYIDRSRAHFRD